MLSLCDGLRERWTDDEPRLRDRLDAQGLGWAVLKWAPPDTWPPMKRAELAALARRTHRRSARGSRCRDLPDHGERRVGGAGRRAAGRDIGARHRGLTAGRSRTRRISPARLTTGEGGQSFADRLAQQLKGASDGVLCLAAELLYIRDAPLHDMKSSTKATRIGAILAAMSGAPPLPEAQGPDSTTATRSRGARATTPAHPSISSGCVRFVLHWLDQSPEVVDEALRDPFAFREVTTSVPERLAVDPLRRRVHRVAWHLSVDRERGPSPKDPRRPHLRRRGGER